MRIEIGNIDSIIIPESDNDLFECTEILKTFTVDAGRTPLPTSNPLGAITPEATSEPASFILT